MDAENEITVARRAIVFGSSDRINFDLEPGVEFTITCPGGKPVPCNYMWALYVDDGHTINLEEFKQPFGVIVMGDSQSGFEPVLVDVPPPNLQEVKDLAQVAQGSLCRKNGCGIKGQLCQRLSQNSH